MTKRKLSNIQKNITAVIYRTALYIKQAAPQQFKQV